MAAKKNQPKNSFSKNFQELEKIVERFESSEEMDIDKNLKDFEEGLKLAERLKKTLDSVENKIETLKTKYEQE